MKNENDIREMLNKYDEKLDEVRNRQDDGDYDCFISRNDFEKQYVFGVMDALLWILGDNCGKAVDEYINRKE